ncbi:MAG: ABC transporter substrate-binding protein, partial [Trueperaceae bacterium]|nr:ABC transporter substrate-binding protein [Trueperaceae bacterium]
MRRTLLALALLLAFGLAAGQTLIYGVSGQPSSLDSVDSQDGNSLVVSNQVTERLIDFAPGTTDLIPNLATAWSSNAAGDVWTFELRQGVTFHDGTAFDAEAVKFNIDRWN